MASGNRQTFTEDVPLIDITTTSATVRPSYASSSIRRKPVPVRQYALNYLPQNHPLSHLGYSTVSEVEEDRYEHELNPPSARVYPAEPKNSFYQAEIPKWLPRVLRLPWFMSIIGFGLLLLLLVIALHVESIQHHGLVRNTETPGLYFAWRFLPTLVAVSYVTMLMIILDAVKHSEAFARLASTSGATAESSIFRESGTWWTALVDSFSRKRNGRRFSIAMLCAALAYILGLFIISPFSSALLQVRDVSISEAADFHTVQIDSQQPLSIQYNTLDFAQTMAHALQNVTTSPWIMGGYSVVPFWPAEEDRPSGAKLVDAGVSWEANAMVFQSEIEHEVMDLVGYNPAMNWTCTSVTLNKTYYFSYNLTSQIFRTQSGCEYGLAYEPDISGPYADIGGLFWSRLSNVTFDNFWNLNEFGDGNQSVLLNHTSQCEPGEVLIVLPPANTTSRPFGYLFRPTYYSALMSITTVVDSDATIIRFDEAVFRQTRKLVTNDFVNTTSLDGAFLSPEWNDFLTDPRGNSGYDRAQAGGPANILAAFYEFDLSSLTDDPDLLTIAKQVRQQFFGRAVQTALQRITQIDHVQGDVMRTENRIVIIPAVAIIIEVTLFINICLLSTSAWYTRLSKRPLGVSQDPAFANTITSLMPIAQRNRALLDLITLAGSFHPDDDQSAVICRVMNHNLETCFGNESAFEAHNHQARSKSNSTSTSWSSGLLTAFVLLLLLLFLCILIAAIVTLYWYSVVYGLSQRAFTYQTSIETDGHSIGNIAPYSIIPTLLGVICGLWWGSVDSVFRSVQPFISMTRRPTTSARGSGLSYQSSYLAWASIRSLNRGHWLLSLVCTGAFLSQIFTISMSALWQPVSSASKTTQTLDQPFQLREVPRLYVASSYHTTPMQSILVDVFRNFTSNWLYGAFSQLTVNASEPIWSQQGWNFVPVSLDNVSLAKQTTSYSVGKSATLATVTVPAIRGRLECTPLAPYLDSRYYVTPVNISQFNATAIALPPSHAYYSLGCALPVDVSAGRINFDPNTTASDNCSYMQSSTALLTADIPLRCCARDANGSPENGIFSYWTPIFGHDDQSSVNSTSSPSVPSGGNIAVKTLYGPAPALYQDEYDGLILVWPAVPSLAMLNCSSIIETASSRVTVDVATKQVKNYTILDAPVPYILAWADHYLQHQLPPGVDGYSYQSNYTVSFGSMFLSALLGAAQLQHLGGCADETGESCYEYANDNTFNYHAPGMNMDYMSYSMLALADYNMSAMLDYGRMMDLAQTVFTTFFQHFVSSNVPMNGSGGWAYQRASEILPLDLMPPEGQTSNQNPRVSQVAPSTVTAVISEPIEKLQMSPLAVYLCLSILVWLLVTTVLILVSKKRYFSPLLQPVETIADVARLVAYSDCYLELARDKGATGLKNDKMFRTKLGWFRSRSDGQARWGIELADDPRVDWLDEDEIRRLQHIKQSGKNR